MRRGRATYRAAIGANPAGSRALNRHPKHIAGLEDRRRDRRHHPASAELGPINEDIVLLKPSDAVAIDNPDLDLAISQIVERNAGVSSSV